MKRQQRTAGAIVKVGSITKKGIPVSRERKNLEKIQIKKPNDELKFVPIDGE